MKRQDYITWDEYFMELPRLSARRSKDPNTQVGMLYRQQYKPYPVYGI